MKEVILIRHAKSDWGHEFLKDVDRPLNERGYLDAYLQSEWFALNHAPPDHIVTSSATRALSTAFIFARQMQLERDHIILEPGIYESSAENLLSIIQGQARSADRIMMFGHNPGFTNLCNELSEDTYFDNIPTCGIVSLVFDKQWKNIQHKTGKLNFYRFPKDFKNQD